MLFQRLWLKAMPIVFVLFSTNTIAAKNMTPVEDNALEPRIVRLERFLNPKYQLQLYQQLNTLQQEVETLRGLVECQQHRLQQLEQQLKNRATTPSSSAVAVPENFKAPLSTEVLVKGETAPTKQQEHAAYEQAWQSINNKPPAEAIQQLERFIQAYPQSTYAPNAYYWLAQLLFKQGNLSRASQYFATVVQSFPKSNKASDAMLKIGIITQTQGDIEKAKAIYKRVVKQYATSPAAKRAKERLVKLS